MSADAVAPRFTMVGAPDALSCEGDACLLPVAESDAEAVVAGADLLGGGR